jgi:hypothetical protein
MTTKQGPLWLSCLFRTSQWEMEWRVSVRTVENSKFWFLEVRRCKISPCYSLFSTIWNVAIRSLHAPNSSSLIHRNPTLSFHFIKIWSIIRRKATDTILMAIQSFVGPWPLLQSLYLFAQSVGLLVQGISPSQGRYLHRGQHKHRINAHRHPCLKWDSNPRSQCSSGKRGFMP